MRGLEVIYTYTERLDQYTIEQLRYRIEPGTWSIGQVYSHIVDVALEYLDNIRQCEESGVEQPLGKTEAGERLFGEGAFPPVKIKLPVGMEYSPNDANNKEDHLHDLNQLIDNMRAWDLRIAGIHPLYKVRHGGFGWLNAREWHDLIEMHTRHHLRQIKEIEERWNKVTVDR
ncbi:DinB family protein [Paenibacillus glycanilyticus]|uniref:DinB family protein n=1 Tax=Paenibacillus glycanilyticus TaxID=126569 RepID=UPI000FD73C2A|nr:DinB family protein [Paenibacillus glycanilyticus]